ncbi:MAG: hypothetical protein JKY88_13390 [Pseudomonadales bacterium]|nr:hypothetical protein [Pseudomonadales bacterium]
MIEKLKNLLGIDNYSSEDENFVRLIQLAKEDESIRERLLAILAMQGVHRQIALNSILESSRLSDAPNEFVSAIEVLQNSKVADRAFEILQN